jgi:LPXTG-motif cell wall-anchored protein
VDGGIPRGNISFPGDTTEPPGEDVPFPTVPAGRIHFFDEYEDVFDKIPYGNLNFPGENPNPNPNDNYHDSPKENPKTGDNIVLIMAGLAVLCGAAFVILKKKRSAK